MWKINVTTKPFPSNSQRKSLTRYNKRRLQTSGLFLATFHMPELLILLAIKGRIKNVSGKRKGQYFEPHDKHLKFPRLPQNNILTNL